MVTVSWLGTALVNLLAGQVQVYFDVMPSSLEYIRRLGREFEIDRYCDQPGPHDAEETQQELGPVRRQNGNALASTPTALQQPARHCVGESVELAIAIGAWPTWRAHIDQRWRRRISVARDGVAEIVWRRPQRRPSSLPDRKSTRLNSSHM